MRGSSFDVLGRIGSAGRGRRGSRAASSIVDTSSDWELLGKTKVREDDMPIVSDENVLWFEISVDDSSSMKTFHSFDDLGGVESSSISTKSSPS